MKKLGLTICALLCGLYLGACADTAIAEHNASLKLYSEQNRGYYETMVVVDEYTKVNYVVVVGSQNSGGSCAITPRLNADGTLYLSK